MVFHLTTPTVLIQKKSNNWYRKTQNTRLTIFVWQTWTSIIAQAAGVAGIKPLATAPSKMTTNNF